MSEAKITSVTATRDQIERLRNYAEELFQIAAFFNHEVSTIRETNGITRNGIEADPPGGYQPGPIECDLRGGVHRIIIE